MGTAHERNWANQLAAAGAELDREASRLAATCESVTVTDLELFVLCNLARVAILSELCKLVEDDQIDKLRRLKTEIEEEIHQELQYSDGTSGMKRLVQSGVALLTQDRFARFLLG